MSRVVVTGAGGLLGREIVAAFREAGDEVIGLTHRDIDLEHPSTLAPISDPAPEVVVNAAAWTDVDGCARDPERAMRVNGIGAGLVASAAAHAGALVVQISTNEVFDGTQERAYLEEDSPRPINPYGEAKLAGERAVASATDHHLIIRTAWLFGHAAGFPARIMAAAQRARSAGEPLRVVRDEWGNPTPVVPLARTIVAAARRARHGAGPRIVHLAGQPPTTRFSWAQAILADVAVELEPIDQADYPRPSRVPRHAVLATDLARTLGIGPISWREAVPGIAR